VARCLDLDISVDRPGDAHTVIRAHPAVSVTNLIMENRRHADMLTNRAKQAF
jgi:hypothetical protein